MAYKKNSTNYSKDELNRQLKKKLDRKVALARSIKKGKESFTPFPKPAKKSNAKTSTKTTKSNRSSSQLRAIFAKKK
jgi:hypothetical protein